MNSITIDLSQSGAESLREAKEGAEVEVECCLCGKVSKNDGKTLELEVSEVQVEGEEGKDSEPEGEGGGEMKDKSAAVIAISIGKK